MRFLTLAAVAALFVMGCQRTAEPPRPSRSLTPEVVGVATEFKWGPCASVLVTLESGQVITVHDASYGDPACANQPTPAPTPFLFGKADDVRSTFTGQGESSTEGYVWERGKGPLLFVGTDDGSPWMAIARWTPKDDWCVEFERGNGAYLDGDRLHMVKGVIVPLAPDFEWPFGDPDEVFPLRYSDEVCFSSEGAVIRVRPFYPH
jgi:hypothetical protein